jgi:hypothetical protein
MSTGYDYLRRRKARVAFAVLKREIVFGMAISTLLLAIGAWRHFAVIGASDPLWAAVAALGGLGLLVAVVFPAAWSGPEWAVSYLVGKLGGWLFAALLTLVYGLLISPIGWALRTLRGSHPIYAWKGAAPEVMEGWRPKDVLAEANTGIRPRANLARRFFGVLRFFALRGHYLILPVLVMLMGLGMALFFVKSSALAPFIYTLF